MKPAPLLLLAVLVLAAGACGTEQVTPSPSGSGEAGEGALGGEPSGDGNNFGSSDCRACQSEACASPEADCVSEPGCARFLACIDACPVATAGDADAECAADCVVPEPSSVGILARAVLSCREQGYGLDCPCGEKPQEHDLLKQECGTSKDTRPCVICEEQKCCQSLADCEAEPGCLEFTTCMKQCSSSLESCLLDCGSENPSGYQLGLDRFACVLSRCVGADECNDREPEPCVACIDARCGAEYVACYTDPGCLRVASCTSDCFDAHGGPECIGACNELDPAGAVLFGAYGGCGPARCASECG